MTKPRLPSRGALWKDGVNHGVGRASSGNERGCEHKLVSVGNVNSQFCNCRTLGASTPEGSTIGFVMEITTDATIAIGRVAMLKK